MKFFARKFLFACICAALASCAKGPTPEVVAQRVESLVSPHRSALLTGLTKTQLKITKDEWKIVQDELSKNPNISLIAYFNRYGEVRWHKDVTMVGKSFDEVYGRGDHSTKTDAIEQAFVRKVIKVRAVPDTRSFEVAIPLTVEKQVVGILYFSVANDSV